MAAKIKKAAQMDAGEEVKTLPPVPADLKFIFGEINVDVAVVRDSEHLSQLYRGKLLRTDLPAAMLEFDRIRSKYK